MSGVVHFEIPAADMDRAKNFYSSIFDWKLENWPMADGSAYLGAKTASDEEKAQEPNMPSINGGIMARTDKLTAPIIALNVSSIDETVVKVEAAGGKVVMPKVKLGDMGYYAYVTDSEGNVIGIWESIKKA